jgi:hypothetical protein
VFPGSFDWEKEDSNLYQLMEDVLREAMNDPLVMIDRAESTAVRNKSQTRIQGPIKEI